MQEIDYVRQLIEQTNQGKQFEYLFFWGHRLKKDGTIGKACLSQWFPSIFDLNGVTYSTAEHFMMSEKARLFDDQDSVREILAAESPAAAKTLGRTIRNFSDQLWDARRFEAVVEGNLAKFSQNPLLKDYLLSTGDRVLVEASPVDRVWGVGMAADNPEIESPTAWQGLNLLGFALMKVRDLLNDRQSN